VYRQFITDKELDQEDICDFRIKNIFCANDDDMNDPRHVLVQVEFKINEIGPIISTVVALTGTTDDYWHGEQPHICDIEPRDVAEFSYEKQIKIFNNKSSIEMAVAFLAMNQFIEEKDENSDVYASRKLIPPYDYPRYWYEYA
jgi:hypothetical protein